MPYIQSNSLRGEYMQDIVDATINEILEDAKGMFGPGATDAFIIKDGQIYYTRDGKEVSESLLFDNELANTVHHILYQAAYHQGKNVGDGSTTLLVFYCYLYQRMREAISKGEIRLSINDIRKRWKSITDTLIQHLKDQTFDLDEDELLSMLYTCTQDADLSAKLYTKLKDAILAGAYIVPRKSNISSDFQVTVYNRPTVKVTEMFKMRSIPDECNDATVLYCNGNLDIAHPQVLAAMAGQLLTVGDKRIYSTIIILCHGITEATRRTAREFMRFIHRNGYDVNQLNNVAIFTMDDARRMDKEEIEDLSTILTEETGIGELVNPITFEHLLYNVFNAKAANDDVPIEDLEIYDADPHAISRMQELATTMYTVMFDAVDGMAIGKELGPVATARYKALQKEAEEEKSGIRRASLSNRLRKSFGMFIDIEVGSNLLKDSQRKFELILDAIISGSTAAREGVLVGNSILYALRATYEIGHVTHGDDLIILHIIRDALYETAHVLIDNCYGEIPFNLAEHVTDIDRCVSNFTLRDGPDMIWPKKNEVPPIDPVTVTVTDDDGNDKPVDICPRVVEPFGAISAILTNSTLPIELAMTKVFHISGKLGFMTNYIGPGNSNDKDARV